MILFDWLILTNFTKEVDFHAKHIK